MLNEGFGKKWIEKILGKVDKDQGVANAGKVLGIGSDGIVTPVEQTGGGGAFIPWKETVSIASLSNVINLGNLKIGDILVFEGRYNYPGLPSSSLYAKKGTEQLPIYVVTGSVSSSFITRETYASVVDITDSFVILAGINNVYNAVVEKRITVVDTATYINHIVSSTLIDIMYDRSASAITANNPNYVLSDGLATPITLMDARANNDTISISNGDIQIIHMS